MIRITLDILIALHDKEIRGQEDKGIKNESLLLSAINNPYNTMFGEELYPTDIDKIAMMTYSLIKNHGFNDGNKRTGIKVIQCLLDDCDIEIEATEEEYIQLALDIAESNYDKNNIIKWIKERIK